jgi:hypothetical protein
MLQQLRLSPVTRQSVTLSRTLEPSRECYRERPFLRDVTTTMTVPCYTSECNTLEDFGTVPRMLQGAALLAGCYNNYDCPLLQTKGRARGEGLDSCYTFSETA